MTSNPTPREVFQANSERVANHAALIARPELREAINVALLEYQRRCSNLIANSPESDSRMAWSIAGAQEFVATFYGLADAKITRARLDPDNLIHQYP